MKLFSGGIVLRYFNLSRFFINKVPVPKRITNDVAAMITSVNYHTPQHPILMLKRIYQVANKISAI